MRGALYADIGNLIKTIRSGRGADLGGLSVRCKFQTVSGALYGGGIGQAGAPEDCSRGPVTAQAPECPTNRKRCDGRVCQAVRLLRKRIDPGSGSRYPGFPVSPIRHGNRQQVRLANMRGDRLHGTHHTDTKLDDGGISALDEAARTPVHRRVSRTGKPWSRPGSTAVEILLVGGPGSGQICTVP